MNKITPRVIRRDGVRVEVSENGAGEQVTLIFGDTKVDLHYSTALKLGTWVRQAASIAKANAGDKSKHMKLVGTLSDMRDQFKRGAGWS